MTANHNSFFWRDPRMPHVELRKVADGCKFCYALHSHSQWSLGAITKGQSTFIYRHEQYLVKKGDLVLMNPEWAHACNPIDDKPWAYFMLYVDHTWLTQLRYEAGTLSSTGESDQLYWQDIYNAVVTDSHFHKGLCTLADCLLDPTRELLDKQTQVVEYLSEFMQSLSKNQIPSHLKAPLAMTALVTYLNQHCTEDLSLDDLCTLSGYSPSHLVRTFKQHFGMTPYAYLINKRIQYSQQQLKDGASISTVALDTGFADQAHFQRTFKRLVAATPNEYRYSLTSTIN